MVFLASLDHKSVLVGILAPGSVSGNFENGICYVRCRDEGNLLMGQGNSRSFELQGKCRGACKRNLYIGEGGGLEGKKKKPL